ncbi:hypothetical protein HOLleu_03240 [Holothuria leucospilota]|uniref:Uncharacterized protein n=1 Tax=Holothuria leucospilota TaxID=206669 RepID=A0A9Q1CSR9_HOLLE|nr:hypothetical protein HOLleu_03240 [Holothuria leucospilota]
MATVDGQKDTELVHSVLQGMRTDQSFNAFFSVVKIKATEQDVNEPSLRRNRRAPRKLEIGTANPEFATSVEDKCRQIYFEAIDLSVAKIKNRFDQPGFKAYMQMKNNYTEDINMPNFEAQLLLLKEKMPREEYTCFEDVYRAYRKVDSANKLLVSEVEILLKLILACPATNAVGER